MVHCFIFNRLNLKFMKNEKNINLLLLIFSYFVLFLEIHDKLSIYEF
jgi:hypothetical protein